MQLPRVHLIVNVWSGGSYRKEVNFRFIQPLDSATEGLSFDYTSRKFRRNPMKPREPPDSPPRAPGRRLMRIVTKTLFDDKEDFESIL